jgi:hypothetical protein
MLLACLLHLLLPRFRRFLGAGLHLNQLSRFRGPAQIITGYAFQYPELRRYDFLMKPVRPDELLNEITRLLGSAA